MLGWDDYFQHVEFVIGQGNRVSFWKDKWCGDTALMDQFSLLFNCSSNREATIEAVLNRPDSGGVGDWNVTFTWGFNDWEVEIVVELFQLLSSYAVPIMAPDGVKWKCNKAGAFDSRSFYAVLNVRPGVVFPWKMIWKVKAPPRVAFFIWFAAWGKILTCENLRLRGYTMVGWCCMCKRDGEMVDHLLIHCAAAQVLWNYVFQAFHIQWVISRSVVDLLFGWWNWFGRHHSHIWNLVPLCLMWTVWCERNSRMFDDMKKSEDQLLASFVESLFDWSRAWGFTIASTVHDFVVVLQSDSVCVSLL